jgi:hypothetical protein
MHLFNFLIINIMLSRKYTNKQFILSGLKSWTSTGIFHFTNPLVLLTKFVNKKKGRHYMTASSLH